jgi:molybdate transport system substrate-binding protein
MATGSLPAATRIVSSIVIASLILIAGCGNPGNVTVHSAASLTLVVEQAAREYTESTGTRVDVKFASSAALATGIEHGAPADIFLSADTEWIDTLNDKALLEPGTARVLAWNSLVAVIPAGRGPAPINQYLLVDYQRIVVCDPDAVPLGKYTRQGLTFMGVWNALQDKLVYAPDARAALAMVERGEVDAGIVYATDALSSKKVLTGFKISEGTHDVIAYTGAIVRGAPHAEAAAAFLEFLGGARGKAIFREHGFLGS